MVCSTGPHLAPLLIDNKLIRVFIAITRMIKKISILNRFFFSVLDN